MMNPVQLLRDLVRIDTTNPPGREESLLSYLEEILTEENLPFVHQRTALGRGNLLSWLPATAAPSKPPLFLISHIDVVGADAAAWAHDPFGGEEDEEGFIYGRGTVDTKQLTVMELCAFLALAQEDGQRSRDVYFLATADEECGSAFGMQYFLNHTVTVNGKTVTGAELFRDSDVISEGGGFPVHAGGKVFYLCESGQKGCGTVEFTVKARRAKGPFFGSGDGMARAMALVEDIGSLALEEKVLPTVKRFQAAVGDGPLSPMMDRIVTAMKRSTITATMVTGRNVNEVKVVCDVRLLPGFGEEYLTSVLEELAQKWDCEYRIVALSKGYESSPESAFLSILENATLSALGKTREQVELLPFVSMGSSDGRFLVDSQARVYGYSPVYDWDMTFDTAVTMVHGINERIHRDSLVLGTQVLTLAVHDAVRKE